MGTGSTISACWETDNKNAGNLLLRRKKLRQHLELCIVPKIGTTYPRTDDFFWGGQRFCGKQHLHGSHIAKSAAKQE